MFGKISTLPYVFGNMTGVGDLAAMGAVARYFRHSKRACKQCIRGEWRLWFVSELIDEVCDINRGVGVAWFSGVGGIVVYQSCKAREKLFERFRANSGLTRLGNQPQTRL